MMKSPFLHFLVLIMPFFWQQVHAKTWVVCPDCSETSIKGAIEKASPYDAIHIKEGLYKEGKILVNKPLSIIGEGFPVLDGENSYQVLTISSPDVIVKGLLIRNIGTSFTEDRAAIRIVRVENVLIEGNKIQNAFFGIYLEKASKCIIRDNTVSGKAEKESTSGNAIHLWYSNNILIERNLVEGHRDGIYLEFVDNSRVVRNKSQGNIRYGLHFMFSNHNRYFKNIFDDNGAGVAVMYSEDIEMGDNTFSNNWGPVSYGLLLKDISDSRIYGNSFISNTIAIYAEGANRNEIKDNDFQNNGWAVKIMGNCINNVFTMNNFTGNTFEVTTNTSFNNNLFNRNFWGDYSGYDLDGDGVGDVPYRPVKLFTYVVERIPPSILLLRSTFVDLLNLAEKVAPVITPETLTDEEPLIRRIRR